MCPGYKTQLFGINSFVTAPLGGLADDRIFQVIHPDFGHQPPDIIPMRARRSMIIVFGDAGGKLDDDFVLFDVFLFLDCTHQQRQLAMQPPAAASAAGQMNHTVQFLFGIRSKSPRPLMPGLFA